MLKNATNPTQKTQHVIYFSQCAKREVRQESVRFAHRSKAKKKLVWNLTPDCQLFLVAAFFNDKGYIRE